MVIIEYGIQTYYHIHKFNRLNSPIKKIFKWLYKEKPSSMLCTGDTFKQ